MSEFQFPNMDPNTDPSADPFSITNIPVTTCLLWLRNIGKPAKELNRELNLVQLGQIISDDANGLSITTDVVAVALNHLGYTIDVSGGSSPLDWFTNVPAWAGKGLKARLEYKERAAKGFYNHTANLGKRHKRVQHTPLSPTEREQFHQRRSQH